MGHRAGLGVLGVAGTAAVVWVALLAAVTHSKFGGDPRGLLFLGEQFYHPGAFAGIPRSGRFGFDGQFYAALATDPFLRSAETLKALDAPGYRASRILLPMLAWLFGLGQARTAIVAYQVLCWVLGFGGVVLAALWLHREGGSPWFALVLAVNAGLATSMFRSTPDGAATALLVAALLLHRARRHGASIAVASLATLARETGVIAALACAIEELVHGKRGRALAYLFIPAVPQVVWHVYVQNVWHPTMRWPGAISLPLGALMGRARDVLRQGRVLASPELWAVVAAAATIAAGVLLLVGHRRFEAAPLALVAFAAVAACLSAKMYVEVFSSARALMAAAFIGLVLAPHEERLPARVALLSSVAAFSIAGLLLIGGELQPLLARL